MIRLRKLMLLTGVFMVTTSLLIACNVLPDLPTRTPEAEMPPEMVTAEPETAVPTEQPAEADEETETVVEFVYLTADPGAAIKAVDLLGYWVNAGAPETAAFDYIGRDSNTYQGYYEADIQPLFSGKNVWFEGAQACDSCHFANNAASAHEMNLSNYAGVMAGADIVSSPPGVSILGASEPGADDYDWSHSKLRARLRNNRMPPGWEFDITEENRDGPAVDIGGTEVHAVDLIADWVDAGVPETGTFGEYAATFDGDVLPLFTEDDVWFDDAQACTGCHFSNSENSYHEMDLSSYAGILAGADVLEEPPGVSILGESVSGAGDYDWSHSKLRERLRNNRMPPGWEFDITEENRDGPYILHGVPMAEEMAAGETETAVSEEDNCAVPAVNLIGDWVDAGVPEADAFSYIAESGDSCDGAFDSHILPLFTEADVWFDGAQACTGCHFANSENSYHEMDLSSYEGIMAGADVLEEPPGVSILGETVSGAGDYDWAHSKLRARLRNNRMPPGWEFDITEENRDGPAVDVNGTEVRAVDLIAEWVNAGVPETDTFGEYAATFDDNIQPLFNENGVWFDGAQACTGCHFANSENSYHEMDLTNYAGIMAGADVLEEPPGVSILGESSGGAGDYDWSHSKLRERLRDNRMPPGWEFDISEENRDGPMIAGDGVLATTAAQEEETAVSETDACAVPAVNLIGDWVNAGVPETDVFSYLAENGDDCDGTFEASILPLFTDNNVWFDGAQACTGCHFANSENSYHEMDLSSYEGILAGADVLEEPPGVSILGETVSGAGDYDWAHSKLRARLRNNRMPPGWEFDITEENRDGPAVDVNGTEVRAVDLIAEWVNAGVPETDTFGEYAATFDDNIQPLFNENGVWFDGAQACTGCHFANSENSYHEMDLTNYAGIMAGADVLEEPPGVSILGESSGGAGDYDWSHSKLRERLRDNRMPPGWEFDISEENRDGPMIAGDGVLATTAAQEEETAVSETDACTVKAVNLIGDWVNAGVPETDVFSYLAENGDACDGTFEASILPLFTENNVWFDGAQACTGCHFANSENSYHEMDLSSYEGILAGADVLEEPPGVSILGETVSGAGDYDWAHSKLRARLRNNRMPPGWEFDISEENRDGPTVDVNSTEVRAVDLIAEWVNAGVPETDTFGEYAATFDDNILPLFTDNNVWFDGAQACTGCHFANSENSYHEMDLSSYAGILAGADVLEEPPGVSILGESVSGAGDYDWSHSKLRERLRDNRMPPGWEFDITEENRDGPLISGDGAVAAEEQPAETAVSDECSVTAVNLIGDWVNAGVPETDVFSYLAENGDDCDGTFEASILPLFTDNNVWFDGAQACTGCHFANSENSYHEMDLSSYEGILAGADVLEEPPGVSILGETVSGAGDYDWAHSKLRARLRNNRMPPGWEFDISEENRDGPTVDVNSTEVRAVDLIAEWVNAGVPETDTFGDYAATFDDNILPLFTDNNVWFDGAQACTGCHFANSENSYHEMDLSSYEGILAGADVLEEPPGVSILGESVSGAGDYDWSHSKLRERLRDNRMPPGWEFDITEENRDGPLVLHGLPLGASTDSSAATAVEGAGECEVNAVDLLGAWVEAGAPESDAFDFAALDDATCDGSFTADILPLFTDNNVWFDGAQACTGCHFANSENSYHEMDLGSYEGILAGADVLEEPPGVSILGESVAGAGDFDWGHSKLRARLRNNRMPPGWEFDISEENRDGPTLDVNGTEVRAVDLIADWVNADVPETAVFGDYNATFDEHVLPLFTDDDVWFEGGQSCDGCHFANSEFSDHEMDTGSYAGILAGADVLSSPPGVSILGESEIGAGDYDWSHSKLRERLRNNRMPPGIEFDPTEANRDGPLIFAGTKQ